MRGTSYILLLIFIAAMVTGAPSYASLLSDEFDEEYDLAWDHYNLGNTDRAIELFKAMQKKYPGSSKLYLTLGSIHLDLGDFDSAEDELRNALLHDPLLNEAVWANTRLGHLLLKKGALDAAERCYRRAFIENADPDALIEAGYGLHRVKVQRFLEGRYEAGRYMVHYFPFGAIHEEDIEWLIGKLEMAYVKCNEILKITTDVPIDVYLYPNVQSFDNLFPDGAATVYPEYGEIHVVINRDYDYVDPVCEMLLHWLQIEMNRHGVGEFISDAIPHLVRGEVAGIPLNEYIKAMREFEYFVDLKVARHPQFVPLIDKHIRGPEVASFISWLMHEYPHIDIRQYLTQQNLEALYGLNIIEAQRKWLEWNESIEIETPVDPAEIESVLSYVHRFDLVKILPVEAEDAFRKGLELIDAGEKRKGENELKRALAIAPDFGLAHYALGRLEWDRDDYVSARMHFETAIENLTEKGTPWGWCHYYLGHILEIDEEYVGSIMHYERVLESDAPMILKGVSTEKTRLLIEVSRIAPSPEGSYEDEDLTEAVELFSFIDVALLNGLLDELAWSFAAELNDTAYEEFHAYYSFVGKQYTTPIFMHQVANIETIGDFVKARVILKLEVPESEQESISDFEEYLRLRRGIKRYFLLLRTVEGLKIVDFVDQPPLYGHARVKEEGGTIIPWDEEEDGSG